MRFLIACTVALFLAPAFASAESQEEPRDALSVSVARIVGKGVYVAWTPAPGAVLYDVYRGPNLESLRWIGQTPAVEYTDFSAPDHDTWYQIVSQGAHTGVDDAFDGPMRGRCLAMRSSGIALTVANCMPAEHPW